MTASLPLVIVVIAGALVLVSPMGDASLRRGPECHWWSRSEQRCRDADVECLGEWDPRPAPADWSSGYSMPTPPEWPHYGTEKGSANAE